MIVKAKENSMTSQPSLVDVITSATAYLSAIDPIMADAIQRVGSCTLVPNPDIFEALIDAIISQQISVKAADTMVARLRHAAPGEVLTPAPSCRFSMMTYEHWVSQPQSRTIFATLLSRL